MKHVAEFKQTYVGGYGETIKEGGGTAVLGKSTGCNNSKLHVVLINSRCGSKVSNGMASYFERNSAQKLSKPNHYADLFNLGIGIEKHSAISESNAETE